ncbi:MAG: hypothetical protein HYY17_15425 [Planctomycetes bacterium]|nr:hypothetical protein [Planctomycetota bacterium]
MNDCHIRDGRLYVGGESLPISRRTLTMALWFERHGGIGRTLVRRILAAERRRAIRLIGEAVEERERAA